MDVLLSIKPVYVNLILEHLKLWEFRKRIFKQTPDRIYIYSSSPVKRIVASFKPGAIFEGTANHLYDILKTEGAGVTKEDLFGYFGGDVYSHMKTGYAIEITDLKILPEPIDPFKLMPGFTAPQSFCYWNALPQMRVDP